MRARWALVPFFFLAACTLGEPEEPGCRTDAECGQGLVCRAGACFRFIGDPAPLGDADASDESDGDTPD
jgi:Cys-rich repeat protein